MRIDVNSLQSTQISGRLRRPIPPFSRRQPHISKLNPQAGFEVLMYGCGVFNIYTFVALVVFKPDWSDRGLLRNHIYMGAALAAEIASLWQDAAKVAVGFPPFRRCGRFNRGLEKEFGATA